MYKIVVFHTGLCPTNDLPPYLLQYMKKKCMKNKHDHINAELDSNTLVFNSLPTSVSYVSDMNALVGLCCAVD